METPMEVPARSRGISPWVLALAVAVVALWADVATKEWAATSLTEPVHVTSWFLLSVRHNAGIFLGSLPVAAVPVLYWAFVGGALTYLAWRMTRTDHLAIGIGYALVAGGLLGNAMSRINGAVVDYLGFGPLFGDVWAFANFADFSMLGGMALLGAVALQGRMRSRRVRAARSPDATGRPSPRLTRLVRARLGPYVIVVARSRPQPVAGDLPQASRPRSGDDASPSRSVPKGRRARARDSRARW